MVPIEKETKICDKKSGETIYMKITYKLKFINGKISMPNSLSDLADNLAKIITQINAIIISTKDTD